MKPNMKTRNTKFALGTLNLKSTPKLTKQSVSLTTHFYSDLKATRKVWVDLQEAFCVTEPNAYSVYAWFKNQTDLTRVEKKWVKSKVSFWFTSKTKEATMDLMWFEFPFHVAEDFETEAWVENWVSGSNSKPILDKFIRLNGFRCFLRARKATKNGIRWPKTFITSLVQPWAKISRFVCCFDSGAQCLHKTNPSFFARWKAKIMGWWVYTHGQNTCQRPDGWVCFARYERKTPLWPWKYRIESAFTLWAMFRTWFMPF